MSLGGTLLCHRPDKAAVDLAPFRGKPTSLLRDSSPLVRAVGFPLRPWSGGRFCGRALTVAAGSLAQWKALEMAERDAVIVIACGERTDRAEFGAVYVGIARRKGVAAIVTDGLLRDAEEIAGTGLPVFARGTHPASPFDGSPGTVGASVTIAGVTIDDGDILAGDADGIALFAPADAAEIAARLGRQNERERALQRSALTPDLPEGLTAALARIPITYV